MSMADVLADRFTGGISEDRFRRPIEGEDLAICSNRDDGIRRGFQNDTQPVFALPYRRLGLFEFGDVIDQGKETLDPTGRVDIGHITDLHGSWCVSVLEFSLIGHRLAGENGFDVRAGDRVACRTEQLFGRLADDLGHRPFPVFFIATVDVTIALIGIEVGEQRRHIVGQRVEFLLAALQFRGAFGDAHAPASRSAAVIPRGSACWW